MLPTVVVVRDNCTLEVRNVITLARAQLVTRRYVAGLQSWRI